MRDSQRSKFWRAVREDVPQLREKLPEVKDIEKFVKRVCTYASLQRRYPALKVGPAFTIGDGRGMSYPRRNGTMLCYPTGSRHKYYVLWLIALYLDSRRSSAHRPYSGASHGWSMCAVYMDLVRYGMGKEAADELKAAFKKHKVRWKKPVERKAEPTEAQLRARRIFSVKRRLYAKPNAKALSQ